VTPVPRVLPVSLPDLPEVADHAIAGIATVPAVELLDLLVRTVTVHDTDRESQGVLRTRTLSMREASFPRFLPVEEVQRCTFAVTLEEEASDPGLGTRTRATFTSRIALAGGIHRTRTHAAVTLGGPVPEIPQPPAAIAYDVELPAARAYQDLIPFGPRFCNLRGLVRLGREGGIATVRSPEPPRPDLSPAGCPYLVDSAMHLACLWAQRYAGYVAYPTGFAARVIASPLMHGQRRCIVVPRWVGSRHMSCDLWLTDEADRVCDAIVGLAMAPLTTGALPPRWVVHPLGPHRLP
jgi:hypothetical protein